MEAALAAARFAHYAATVVLFGAALFPLYAGPDARFGRRRLALSAGLAWLTGLVWLAMTSAAMMGAPSAAFDPASIADIAIGTDFGRIWTARLALALACLGAALWAPRMTTLLSGVLLSSVALTGHVRSDEGGRLILHGVADAVHLLAAGAWIGGLVALAVRLKRPEGLAEALRGFSGMGTIAVAALVVSGLINAALLLPDAAALATSNYGRLLCGKIVVFASMLGLAALNRWRLSPAIAGGSSQAIAQLKRSVLLEQGLAACLLAIVGLLGTLDPAS